MLELIIGNKNYSSWSLRAWLLLTHFEVPFLERRIALGEPDTRENILRHSPAGRVPVLKDSASRITVWDSLAITEYTAERLPDRSIWPGEPRARAAARSVCAEMHSSFFALRNELPMNCRAKGRTLDWSDEAGSDIARILALWAACRAEYGSAGPWLFGEFSPADAFFAPVAIRFTGYSVSLSTVCQQYVKTVVHHPGVMEWIAAGEAEAEVIEAIEVGRR